MKLAIAKRHARQNAIMHQRTYVVYGHPVGNYSCELWFGQSGMRFCSVKGYVTPDGRWTSSKSKEEGFSND